MKYEELQARYGLKRKIRFIATDRWPDAKKVLATASDYRTLVEKLKKKNIYEKKYVVQFLEPKETISAF